MVKRDIGDYHFLADPQTGITFRWGKTVGDDPTFAPVPELADISICNRCSKGCPFCYRDSGPNGKLMTLEDYCQVLDSMNHPEYGNVFQVALGGGEPLEHPEFLAIIDETVRRGIVPNFTTNGQLLTGKTMDAISGKVGAMAISVTDINEAVKYRELLGEAKVKVNLHYILSQHSIGQAIEILDGRHNNQIEGVNAIVFLTYKPAGRGGMEDILKPGKSLTEFLNRVEQSRTNCRIGFDACFVPMLLRSTRQLNNFVDCCEGGFFSVYVNEKKEVSPCSFSCGRDSYSLDEYDFYDIWNNQFQTYRDKVANHCTRDCKAKTECRGACTFYPMITTCYGV